MGQYVAYRGVWCQVVEHGWRVKEWVSPDTGQREVIAWKKRCYIPQGPIPVGDAQDEPDDVFAPPPIDQSGTVLEAERLERQRLLNLEKSAKRAKRTCRHKIKSSEFASLLTCTYRENMGDFNRVRRDWADMLRKLQRAIPGFRAVYAFEQQERGAWHVHAAIHRLPPWLMVPEGTGRATRLVRVRSWDYVRRLWHSVVGKDNGNIDVDGHRRTRHGLPGKHRPGESLAKLAGYVSKYLTKDYAEGLAGRNRWGSTQGLDLPKPVIIDVPDCPLHDLIELAFHVPDGHRIVRHRIGQFGRFWCLFSEPGEPDLPVPCPDH
ncbi:rolling circle replication-associated protein [Hydrogenophaga electricum]|uniref:Replication-associated protein ORF2/G2P domain-containing protein n=1 Tax=Hydrogenophaga electricum TaxID=1230953 RepID=A0ABQ6C8K7_9BURK|nr:hypothetical protein [Hydrogenophaga electricum]GLS16576.1 hypothetical protein GCM10007935_40180 [Hydrogenophaga electricum]